MNPSSAQDAPSMVSANDLVQHLEGVREFSSSADRPWSGLLFRRLLVPSKFHSSAIPALPDIFVYSTHRSRGARRFTGECWEEGSWEKGCWGIVPPGRSFGYWYHCLEPVEEPLESTHLHLDPEMLSRVAEESAEVDPEHVEIIPRLAAKDPLIGQLAEVLRRELEEHRPADHLLAETVGQMLAVHLLREHCVTTLRIPEFRGGLPPARRRRVKDLIMARLEDPPSLEELAREAGLSVYHFCRQFKKSTGYSPHRFVMQRRLEKARELLSRTDQPIVQVALSTGFASPPHFSTVFRNTFGETPSEYRRKTRH